MVVEESGLALEAERAPGLRARAIREGSAFIGCKWVAQGLSWMVTLGVARLLVPADYGVMAAAGMVLGLSDLLAEGGVGRALVQRPRAVVSEYAEAFTLSLVLSLGCYACILAGAGPAARFLRTPELTRVLPVMGSLVLLVPFRTVPLGILDRRLDMKAQGIVNVYTTILQASIVLGLAFLGARYWSLVAGAIAGRLFESVSLCALARWRPRVVVPGRGAGEMLRFGLWMSLGGLLWYVYSNSDYAVVGRIAGPAALGYYSLAFQLMSLPAQKVTANINQMIFPVFCRLRDEPARIKDWYLRLSVLTIFLVLPVLLGAALVARDGIETLFGAKWLPAVLPFQLLSGVGVLGVVAASHLSLLNSLGRPDLNFRYTAACAAVFPIGFSIAGEHYGVIGVCLAWLSIYAWAVALLVALTKGITNIKLGEMVLAQWPVARAAALMAVVVLAAQALLGAAPPAARLVAAVAAGAAAYAGCLMLTARHTVLADLRIVWRELKG